MPTLRHRVLVPLLATKAEAKAELTRSISPDGPTGSDEDLREPAGIPGRPARPELVPHIRLQPRSMAHPEGRAALIHALAHIELNAIDLALDLVWRARCMPDEFYRQWLAVAQDEALHFQLLRQHLQSLGYDYGSFAAHNALWEMAEKTKHDILARIALVPRTLEARGLDASPGVKVKLVGAGDRRAGEILDVILADEITHVAVGNRWYRWLCEQRGLDPIASYRELARRFGAPRPRGPFNLAARRAAGFTEEELASLE